MLRENDSSSFVSLVVLPPLQTGEAYSSFGRIAAVTKCDKSLQGEAFVEVFSISDLTRTGTGQFSRVRNHRTHIKQYQSTSLPGKRLTIFPSHENRPRTIFQALPCLV